MSRAIIEDAGNFWQLSGSGDVKLMGTVNGTVDLQLVGKIDTYSINGTPVSISPTTGFHYKTGVVTPFNAYDGFETSEAVFYFAAYSLLLLYTVHSVGKLLAWKSPS